MLSTNDIQVKTLEPLEPPTPVFNGLRPLAQTAVEKKDTVELHKPGEFCYRNMAMASGGDRGKTVFAKRVMMNCPFCNKPQFLYNNEKVYDGAPDPRRPWQKLANLAWQKFRGRELFAWSEQLTGTLTIKGPITCHFNNLHRWTVVKNNIAFFYPKALK